MVSRISSQRRSDRVLRSGATRRLSLARRVILALLCGAVGLATPAWADDVGGEPIVIPAEEPSTTTTEAEDDDWQFTIAPYGWFVFIPGTIIFMDEDPVLVDLSFDELWNQLHMALFLDFEVQKGDFGFFSDLVWAKLWTRGEGKLPTTTFKNDFNLVIYDFGLYYEVLNIALGSGSSAPKLRLQPLFGGRFFYLGLDVRQNSAGSLVPNPSYFQPRVRTAVPILGLRGFIDINDRWNISFVGDGGGFGVDGMNKTWQAELLGGYRFHPTSKLDLNLMIGYKGLGIDQSSEQIETHVVFHGPVLKLGFEF